jgi:hypothetical protein
MNKNDVDLKGGERMHRRRDGEIEEKREQDREGGRNFKKETLQLIEVFV